MVFLSTFATLKKFKWEGFWQLITEEKEQGWQ